MLQTTPSPSTSMLSLRTPPHQPPHRSRSTGIPEPLATHHIISHVQSNNPTLEIQQKRRTALWAKTTTPLLGRPILQITTPKVDGEAVVATAKLRSNGCKVMLGDPRSQTKAGWTHVANRRELGDVMQFVYDGVQYIWRRSRNTDASDCSGDDLPEWELVTSEDCDTILAAYHPQRGAGDAAQVGKLDYMLNLGPKLALLCLSAFLRAQQISQQQRGRRCSAPQFLADIQQSLLSAKVA